MKKAIEVPWLVGDECWTLRPVDTWSDPVECPECGDKGERHTKAGNIQQCPDCRGRKVITTKRTTWYTRWGVVSWVEVRCGWNLESPHFSVSVGDAGNNPKGKAVLISAGGEPVSLDKIFATEEAAVEYAKQKGLEWHPAIEGKRPREGR